MEKVTSQFSLENLRWSSFMIALLVLTVIPLSVCARTIYVPSPEAPTIDAGVGVTMPGDTVVVECGTYTWDSEGTGDYFGLIHMTPGVVLRSATGRPSCVTIDAQGQGRVFWFEDITETSNVIGFTITGGAHIQGGGLYFTRSWAVVETCVVRDNEASEDGGGAFVELDSHVAFISCEFLEDTAGYAGGGLHSRTASYTIVDGCEFEGCHSGAGGGGAHYIDSYIEMRASMISSNTSGDHGAGLQVVSSDGLIECCIISGNSGSTGSGIYFYDSPSPLIKHCLITGNHASDRAGGIRANMGASPTLEFCTIAGNRASYGGGIAIQYSTVGAVQSIIWGNCAGSASGPGHEVYFDDTGSSMSFSCCDADTSADGIDGGGIVDWLGVNISEYPEFREPIPCNYAPTTGGSYALLDVSPCISVEGCDGYMGACSPEGEYPDTPPTAVEQTTWGAVKAAFH